MNFIYQCSSSAAAQQSGSNFVLYQTSTTTANLAFADKQRPSDMEKDQKDDSNE